MFTSPPYEATRFFNEKPEIYQITLTGPETRGKLNVCGVPIFGNLLPFKCSDTNMFIEGNFSQGRHTFYVFKTKSEKSYKDPSGGRTLSTTIQRVQPIDPPLAGAKEIGPPINPPTHNIISSRRIFYSYETAVEMVITAWKNI